MSGIDNAKWRHKFIKLKVTQNARRDYDRIRDEAAPKPGSCECDTHQITRKKTEAGERFIRQCLTCGANVGKWIARSNLPCEIKALPEFDIETPIMWQAGRDHDWENRNHEREMNEVRRCAQNDYEWFAMYDEYLASPQWRRDKRSKVIAREGGMCQGCGDRNCTQVHHLTYARVGDEMLFDLVALCDECHTSIHDGEAKG